MITKRAVIWHGRRGRLGCPGLHLHLDSGNLRGFFFKDVDKCRGNLPELGGDRAGVGVDDEPSELEIGYPGAANKRTWSGGFENALQAQQAGSMTGHPGKPVVGPETFFQAACLH